MKRFRSTNRAIRRGNLRYILDKIPTGFSTDGQVQFISVPKLQRKSSNDNKLWLAY